MKQPGAPKPVASQPERRIEYLPLASLQGAARNPKKHAVGDLTASVDRFGFVETPVLDGRTQRLVAGHGRLEVLRALQAAGKDAPRGVRVDGGRWMVPVELGWSSASDTEAEAYLVASNRLTEAGGWDDEQLAALLKDVSAGDAGLAGVGFTDKEFNRLLASVETATDGLVDPDGIPEPKDVRVKRGDLWLLGTHRLLCGDSTQEDDVERLMGADRAGLMNTDPPYGVSYRNDDRPGAPAAKPAIVNDDLHDAELQAFLEAAFRAATGAALRDNAAWYLWHAHLTQGFFAAAAAANVVLHRQIIWVKPALLLGRGQYHWRHEPCFMGWVKGHQPPDYAPRNQTTVWELDGVPNAERRDFDHATPKPVALFEGPISKHLAQGEICFEPFAGSGPQVIAAERLARRCYAIEIEPKYCQVIIDRWERFTGKKASLESDPLDRVPKVRKGKATQAQVDVAEVILGNKPAGEIALAGDASW